MDYCTSRSTRRLSFRSCFLIDINVLPDSLKSMCKIFSDYVSLFSKIKDLGTSNVDVNNNLIEVSEIYFSHSCEKTLPQPTIFNSNNKLTSPCQKHQGLASDSKLSVNERITQKLNKSYKK